jgi:hypothetical protein
MVHTGAGQRSVTKAIIVTDELEAGDAGRLPPRPPRHHPCTYCGGTGWPMAVLDSRKGKKFRLIRCLSCEKLDWAEEQ